jgi:hypothetical protein
MASRIGVLTFHKCINYGSYWQARCLAEGLRALGHRAEILDHECKQVALAELRCALQPKLPERTRRQEMRHYAAKTRRFFEAFAALPLSRRFPLHDPAALDGYDAVVVGSDEVWNFRHPWYGSQPIFFGQGLKADRLVSYAASFGNHSASDGIHPDWAGKLHRFSALSVRDRNSWQLVNNGTGRDPRLVLDPVLQFPASTEAGSSSSTGKFVLVYGHGFPEWLARKARSWSEKAGVRLVSVGYANEWADEQRIGVGPFQFAELMANAGAVITNFFHGCVFALRHGKPWATVPSDYRSTKVRDLTAALGAEHHLIDESVTPDAFRELLETPLSTEVTERIEEHRQQSQDFLSAALS